MNNNSIEDLLVISEFSVIRRTALYLVDLNFTIDLNNAVDPIMVKEATIKGIGGLDPLGPQVHAEPTVTRSFGWAELSTKNRSELMEKVGPELSGLTKNLNSLATRNKLFHFERLYLTDRVANHSNRLSEVSQFNTTIEYAADLLAGPASSDFYGAVFSNPVIVKYLEQVVYSVLITI